MLRDSAKADGRAVNMPCFWDSGKTSGGRLARWAIASIKRGGETVRYDRRKVMSLCPPHSRF